MAKPKLIVLAGVNGAGKSTLHEEVFDESIQFINPDVIARNIAPNDFDNPVISVKAGRQAIEKTREILKTTESFIIENTLTSNQSLKTIRQAKDKGYEINLYYIGLANKELSIKRVESRHLAGGHNIPIDALERRYDKSIANLPTAMSLADNIFIFDNSQEKRQTIFAKDKENTKFQAAIIPIWAKTAIENYQKTEIIAEVQKIMPLNEQGQRDLENTIDQQLEATMENGKKLNVDELREHIKNGLFQVRKELEHTAKQGQAVESSKQLATKSKKSEHER